jgi:hypothetical protein
MKTWHKAALMIVPPILILGIGILIIHHQRSSEPVASKPQVVERPVTDDEVVQPRKMYIASLNEAKDLAGRTVWIQAGYALDSYPYAGGQVEFAHPVGVLPSVQELAIEKVITEKAPANLATRFPVGDRQVFTVFKMPSDAKEYATAIGTIKGTDETYYCDEIFYYDDPRKLYKHWPADVWQAVDQHQPKPGMNELQVSMALGTIQQAESSDYGNRTVTYDAGQCLSSLRGSS